MKTITVLVIVAAVASSVQAANCGVVPTQFALTSFISTPSPPCIGRQLCISVSGTLNTPIIEGSKLNIAGKFLNHLVYADNYDLCKLLADQGTPCPLPITTTDATVCINVKTNAPPNVGSNVTFAAFNGDGGTIWCEETKGVVVKNC
ncbi:hypothetical protein BGW38_007861 [Lunasporangiospora selenospora]|uniref:Phosphatidylglycerol/phosphatidylinositol transfer protein n=1 Tax=Lunasporangiospora selenospora TaxID=979761 RepID=A0A9P6FYY6_9FUNG|nr:hypothetical protein BGW38_007861 [Lunasporangiospora selenospora]